MTGKTIKMTKWTKIVCYSDHHLNTGPFNDHLNTRLVCYSDPHCIHKCEVKTNCIFFSAEEHLVNLFKRIAFSEVICVLDPPRGGLGPKAINHIRRNEAITKLVRLVIRLAFYFWFYFVRKTNTLGVWNPKDGISDSSEYQKLEHCGCLFEVRTIWQPNNLKSFK